MNIERKVTCDISSIIDKIFFNSLTDIPNNRIYNHDYDEILNRIEQTLFKIEASIDRQTKKYIENYEWRTF